MTFQRVPHTAEIVIVGERGGQEIVNTFYAQMEDGYALADIELLAETVDTWCGADWRPFNGSDYSYVRTDVRGLDASIDLAASNSDHAGVGAHTASPLSNNASLAVSRRSGFTGRGARGRIYLPPPSAFYLTDDNHLSAAGSAGIVASLDAMDEAISATGWLPVIVHRVAAGVPLAEAVVFTLVEWVVVDLVIDSMRRRLPGRGV